MYCLGSTVAWAGTVHFDPPSAVITPGTPSVSFEVSVSTSVLSNFDTVSIVVGAGPGVELDFDYAQSFLDSLSIPPFPGGVYCIYGDCMPENSTTFGGNNFSTAPWNSPLLVGTLTVDTSSLSGGQGISVAVDPELEAQLLGTAASLVAIGANQEPLGGLATITVVPEPGIVGLMVVGMLVGCVRRSRREGNPQPRWGWR